jgi:hypothetical protein
MSLLAMGIAVLVCGWSILLGFHGKTFLGRPLGGDFVQYYVAGKILNHYEAWRIYDLQLAVGLQHATVATMAQTQMLVFGHAPYVALLFRPFALLPYGWAYVAWLGFSAALYLAGLALVFRAARLTPDDRKTGYLLAGSSMPFLFETWIGGQLSVVVFFAWALFFYYRYKDRGFLAGMALALAVFKPTLIVLPAAMLFCGKRWRTLAGLATGTFAMALLSFQVVGWQGCQAWVDTLLFDSRFAKNAVEVSHLAKSVDMNTFVHLLLGGAPRLATVAFFLIFAAGFVALAAAWWRLSRRSSGNRPGLGFSGEDSLWAATLCGTLVLSPYAPIYDAILVVAAAALLAGSMEARGTADRQALGAWLLLLYMTAWITQSFAEFLHLQLYTLVLAGFGVWAVNLAYRSGEAGQEARQVFWEREYWFFSKLAAKPKGFVS